MRSDLAPTPLRRAASLAVCAATALALANLPAHELPVAWLLAFTIPGAVLGLWARLPQAPWRRALLAVVLQASACYAALELAGPMTRPAALACTILPPLAFATARNHDADPSLALFLGFCVMLVGIILDGIAWPLLIGYGVAAFLSLHLSTLLQSHRTSNPNKPARRVTGADLSATSTMMLTCLVVVFAVDRTLSWLPSPSRGADEAPAAAGGAGGNRSVGLDDSFRLDGASGELSQLTGEQLVRAELQDGAVPADLYLRCGFFTLPSLGEWQIGRLALRASSEPDGHRFRDPTRDALRRRLTIERFAGAQRFVFVPPNALEVTGLRDLRVDPEREWIRTARPNADPYEVVYEERLPPAGERTDPRGRRLGLLQVMSDWDTAPLERLMNQWGVGFGPRQAMAAVERGLARHCRYDRREPTGPYEHALENFLFAPDDRHGYCMHFASAAALVLRLRGIPCRVAVGLYGGAPHGADGRARIYGSQHAHAWVEVLFRDDDGPRYEIFDPTPPDMRARGFLPSTRLDQPSDPDVEGGQRAEAPLWRPIAEFLTQPWLWALALVVTVLAALVPRRLPQPPGQRLSPTASEARRALLRLLRALARVGDRRAPNQTLEQFAHQLDRRGHLLPPIAAALRAYQEVRFGGRPFDAPRAALLQHAARAAEQLADREPDAQLVAAGQT